MHARHTPESRYTTQPAHQLVYLKGDLKFEEPPNYYHHVSQSNGKWFYSHSYLKMESVPVDATELAWAK